MEEPSNNPFQPASLAGAVPEPEPKRGGFTSEAFEFVWETMKVVLIALVIILPVRYFLIQPFFVKGSSMVPNFHDKEYILVDKWTYKLGRAERGDVIVFKSPTNPKEYYIKRIIGLPGETVLVANNTVTIYNARYPDGFILNEAPYHADTEEYATLCMGTTSWCGQKVTLEEDRYFVLGDNRKHSSDGRAFGPITYESISGMAWLRLWPLNEIGFIHRTEYPPVTQ